ncbi:MAG: asparagine synthase C-terminal domain-containing protein [Haloarculaceae archaeon]
MRGASPGTARQALRRRDPFPGTRGFAGSLDGALVRDVLGRRPVFVDAGVTPPLGDDDWSFDRSGLDDPRAVPPGTRRDRETGESDVVWTLPESGPVCDRAEAVAAVRGAIERSLAGVDTSGLAVAFSGGVDSALLAARLDVPLYVAGFEGSHDLEAARTGAELLDREVAVVEFTHDDIRRAVPAIAAATGRTDAMAVQIALPLYLVAERVAADGYERLATGQGADELFGGYAKVARAPEDPRVEADTVRGARREVLATLPEQAERDVLALRAAGVEPVAPLVHDAVVEAALRLPESLLVEDGERKVALRRAVSAWLPRELTERDKKAAQYGSLAARELDRLARRAGFKRRMDDHVTKYVESLVE